MLGYIYKTTNLKNNKIYIGKHNAETFDEKYFGSGKMIKRAIAKYGLENFTCEILDVYASNNECIFLEKWYIEMYKSYDNSVGYNITPGGEWGDITLGMSQDDYEKWVEKLRVSHTGNVSGWDAKRREAASKRFSGSGNNQYGKVGVNKGKSFSDNWKENISKSLKGRTQGSRSKNIITLYVGHKSIMCFKGKSNAERYCKEIGLPITIFKDSLNKKIYIKDVELSFSKNQYYEKNLNAIKEFGDYCFVNNR